MVRATSLNKRVHLQPLPLVSLKTNSTDALALLVDTGSQANLIYRGNIKPGTQIDPVPSNLRVRSVTGDPVEITGTCQLILYKNDTEVGRGKFLITSQQMDQFDGILGNDWLKDHNAQIDYSQGYVLTNQVAIPFRTPLCSTKACMTGLTIVEGRSAVLCDGHDPSGSVDRLDTWAVDHASVVEADEPDNCRLNPVKRHRSDDEGIHEVDADGRSGHFHASVVEAGEPDNS